MPRASPGLVVATWTSGAVISSSRVSGRAPEVYSVNLLAPAPPAPGRCPATPAPIPAAPSIAAAPRPAAATTGRGDGPAHGRAVSAPRARRSTAASARLHRLTRSYSSSLVTAGSEPPVMSPLAPDAAQAREGRGDGVAVQIADRGGLERRGRGDARRPVERLVVVGIGDGQVQRLPHRLLERRDRRPGHFWPGLLQQVGPPSASGSDTGPGNMRGLAIAPVGRLEELVGRVVGDRTGPHLVQVPGGLGRLGALRRSG